METTSIYVRDIPVDTWRKLKAKAALEGLTVPASVTKAIMQYVAKSA